MTQDDDVLDPTVAERADEPAREVVDAPDVARRDVDDAGVAGADVGAAADDAGDSGSDAVEDERSRDELLVALAAAEQERDEYLDRLQRVQAEFQNYRKRAMREGAEQRDQGSADVLKRLIEVVDDFELAVLAVAQAARAAGQPDQESAASIEGLRKGVDMVYGKLVDTLRGFGLEKIGQEGVPFDPELHEAVQHEHDDEDRDGPVVAEVMRNGYMVNDRVLRPAMVKVVE